MGLVVYWYDAFCFGIIGGDILGSTYILWKRKKKKKTTTTATTSTLLVPRLDTYYYNNDCNKNSQQLWSSCWRGIHPACLLLTRFTSFLVLAFLLSWDIHVWGSSIFIYYTEWTFALVMLYFAIGTAISAYACWLYHSDDPLSSTFEETRDNDHPSYYQEQHPHFLGYIMQTAYQTCASAVILTDIVFWGIIVPLLSTARLGLNLLMGCMHTVNIVLLLLDTSINRLQFPWFRLAYFVLWSSAYVVFQWVIHLFGFSWWPYPFLELSTPTAPLWYLVLAVFHIACYGLYALIVKGKDYVFSRLFPDSYISLYC